MCVCVRTRSHVYLETGHEVNNMMENWGPSYSENVLAFIPRPI